LIHNIEKLQ